MTAIEIRVICLATSAALVAACGGTDDANVAIPGATQANLSAGIALPPGFSATLFADGLPSPRHLGVTADGRVYVTLRSGQARLPPTDAAGGVAGLADTDGDGTADVTRTFGRTTADTGLALRDDYVYYSTTTGIYAFPLGDELLPSGPEETVVADMPDPGNDHRTKVIAFDGEGHLYTQVGAPSNSCQIQAGMPGSPGISPCTELDEHGGVFRFLAASRNQIHAEDGIRYSRGHRDIVALEWHPSAAALFGIMRGRDDLNRLWPALYSPEDDAEMPGEALHRIDQGDDLGWPYTYWDPIRNRRIVSPEYGGNGATVSDATGYDAPLIAFPAHWAPSDIAFYTHDRFPEHYRHGAFVAFNGTADIRRAERSGPAVVFVPMTAAGEIAGDWEPFADGFETASDGNAARPAGLAVGPDGALYVADDAGGRIWKITYDGA